MRASVCHGIPNELRETLIEEPARDATAIGNRKEGKDGGDKVWRHLFSGSKSGYPLKISEGAFKKLEAKLTVFWSWTFSMVIKEEMSPHREPRTVPCFEWLWTGRSSLCLEDLPAEPGRFFITSRLTACRIRLDHPRPCRAFGGEEFGRSVSVHKKNGLSWQTTLFFFTSSFITSSRNRLERRWGKINLFSLAWNSQLHLNTSPKYRAGGELGSGKF